MAKRRDRGAPAQGTGGISIAGHPRSAVAVRRAKGWGGLLGLVLGTTLALGAHVPLEDALLRGLAGGILGYVALWAIAVTVARQLVIAEVRARYAEVVAAAAATSSSEA